MYQILIHVAAMWSTTDSKLVNISQFTLPTMQYDQWHWSVDSYAKPAPTQRE